jgi:4-amino-4-deoxy-L-arabinose transferase-like glycosyltransferase
MAHAGRIPGAASGRLVMPGPARFAGLARSSLALIFGVALLLRLFYVSGATIWPWHTWDQTDMDTYLRVAHQILQGDLLVSRPYHPYHSWQRAVAPAAKWDAWNDPHAFFHVPGYYYFLALVLKLSGGSLAAVMLTQATMGATQAALLAAVAARLLGRLAGLVAGLLAATYGPFIAAEAMVLREGLGLFLATAALAAVVYAWDHAPGPEAYWSSWLAAGVLLGLGALVKETGFVLFAAVTVWGVSCALRSRDSRRWRPVLVLSGGFLLALSPLMARNLMVGTVPLARSSLGSMAFLMGNAPDSPSGGVLFDLAPSFGSIMEGSQGALLPTVRATLAGYEASPGRYLAYLWNRFSAVWSDVEIPDNYSYQYLLTHSILLQSLPRFACVWLPAVLGMVLWSGRRHRVTAATVERTAVPAPMLWLLVSIVAMEAAALSLVPVMARYRLVIVPFLMLPAAGVLAELATHCERRHWRSLVQLGVALAGIAGAWAWWPTRPLLLRAAIRPADYATGARFLMERGHAREAYLEFDRGIAHSRTLGLSERELRERALLLRRSRLALFLAGGRFDAVQEDWEAVSAALPGDPLVQTVRRQQLDRGDNEMQP